MLAIFNTERFGCPRSTTLIYLSPPDFFLQEMDCDLNDMGDDTTKEKLEEDMKTRDEKARNWKSEDFFFAILGIAIWQRFQ